MKSLLFLAVKYGPSTVVGLLFLILALLMSHTMLPLQDFASNCLYGDMVIFSYIASWGAHALFNCPAQYYSPPIFYPYKNMLPGTDGIELVAFIISPFWHLTKNPVLTGNIALLLSHLFTLVSAYVTTRVIFSLQRPACVLIAVFFAVSSDRFWHSTGHLNLVWSGILPLIFLAVWLALNKRLYRSIIYVALAQGFSIYFSVYFFVLGGIIALIAATLWMILNNRLPNRRGITFLFLGMVLAVIVAAPKIAVYKSASARASSARNSLAEAAKHSASFEGYIKPSNIQQSHYDSYWNYVIPMSSHSQTSRGEDSQFLGYLLLLLIGVEIIRLYTVRSHVAGWDKLSLFAILITIYLVLASLGPHFGLYWENSVGEQHSLSPYSLLYYPYLSFSGFFRAPARLAFIVQWVALIPIAVLCINIPRNIGALKQSIYCSLFVFLICFEHLPARNLPQIVFSEIEAYNILETLDPTHKQPYVCAPAPRKLEGALVSCTHWRPTVNGWVGSPLGGKYDQLYNELHDFPTTASISWLQENNIPWILVTTDANKNKAMTDPRIKCVYAHPEISLFKVKGL